MARATRWWYLVCCCVRHHLEGGLVQHRAVVVGADGAKALADLVVHFAWVGRVKCDWFLRKENRTYLELDRVNLHRLACADGEGGARTIEGVVLWADNETLERLDLRADVVRRCGWVRACLVVEVVAVGRGGQRENTTGGLD